MHANPILARNATQAEALRSLPRLTLSPLWSSAIEKDPARALRVMAGHETLICSATDEARAALEPTTQGDIIQALTAVYSLVVPVGATQADRNVWNVAAADALKGIPRDLLDAGIKAARKVVDHPSKIIPAIMKEVEGLWRRRRDDYRHARWLLDLKNGNLLAAPKAGETVSNEGYCTPEQVAAIKAEYGLSSSAEDRATVRANLGPPRKPTPAEIQEIASAMGVAPATGENLPPVADIRGLSIAEIFAQRDRRAAEALMGEGWLGCTVDETGDADDWRAVA